jgi:hypothetical protein
VLSDVVERCALLLAATPDPVLPAPRISARRPSRPQDVPAVVVAVAVDEQRPGAVGRSLRWDAERRDVRAGDVYSGVLRLEAWAPSAGELDSLTAGVERRLRIPTEAARGQGMLRLFPASLEPAEHVLIEPPTGSPAAAWRQRLSYRFTCEIEDAVTDSAGGVIKRIDVGERGVVEGFSVTEAAGVQ